MEAEEFFRQGLALLNINLTDNAVKNCLQYCTELQKWNQRINLIARNTTLKEIIEKHFLDSLTLLPVIRQYGSPGNSLLDVGTGAGFPGMVLAAVDGDLQVTLVEPRQKRVSFLKHIIRTLQLSNVTVVEKRLEDADHLATGSFTFITCRAVAEALIFLPMIREILGIKTIVILMQGKVGKESRLSGNLAYEYELLDNQEFRLPFSGSSRCLKLVQLRA